MRRYSFKISIRNRCVPGSLNPFNARISPVHHHPDQRPGATLGSSMKSSAAVAALRAKSSCTLFTLIAVLFLHTVPLQAESANSWYKRGQSAEAKEDYDTAYDDYQKALAKAPKDLRFRTAMYRVRVSATGAHMTKGRKLLASGDLTAALAEFLHAAEIDPGNEAAQQEIAHVRILQGQAPPAETEANLPMAPGKEEEIESMGAPVTLKPMVNEPLVMHYSEDAKVVYQAIGKAAGINVLFDPDWNSKRIQVDLVNSSLLDALRIVGTLSGTFWRPVTSNTIFVAQNTRAKRTELDEQAVQTFYLTNAWQQNDLNDVQTALRNVLTNVKVYGVASQNAIVIRGTPDELLLAQKLVNDLDKARPEVVVDIAILEVSKNWERTLGIAWPSSVGVALQPPCSSSSSSSNCSSTSTTSTGTTASSSATPSLYDLSHLKASDFAVTIGAATANLLLSDANTKTLQSPRIRCTDGQKATMKIGERIPVATGSYQTGAATALVSSLVNTQFQYLDVGVNIEMTPTIHYDHDVTLKIKIEDTSEGSPVTISGVTEPIIIQKTSEQVLRLREGEASILGGIEEKQDEVSWSGIPGLSQIPVLRYLFGSKDHTITDDELVFLVVPHIVRSQQLDPINLRTIDTGVGNQIELRRSADGAGTPSAEASPLPAVLPVRPAAVTHSNNVGAVPGESAEAAAPAALAQMRAAADSPGSSAVVHPPASPAPAPANQAPPASPLSLTMPPLPGPVTPGAIFKVPVVLSAGNDITSVPMQVQFDPGKLALENVDRGDFLGKDGQAVTIIHREDDSGNITINATRPPGAAGINGSGTVCILTFQAKSAGDSAIAVTHAAPMNSAQKQLQAQGGRVTVQVR
jgi:general secretion pathway protein D